MPKANKAATAGLIYPHQLFDPHPVVGGADFVVFIEDPLFFSQFEFHRQKRMLHRAAMKSYAQTLQARGVTVHYLDAREVKETGAVARYLRQQGAVNALLVQPSDDWLLTRITSACEASGIGLRVLDDPHFLTSVADIHEFANNRAKLFFTQFYIAQRKRMGVLMDGEKPVGGKWSFDPENRKRLPTSVAIPPEPPVVPSAFSVHAKAYVDEMFPNSLGSPGALLYPVDHASAKRWLDVFVNQRLSNFGDYEDAISQRSSYLFHSVLTPVLNIGLLSPKQVIDAALAQSDRVPINSLEGFIRQVIGWREYVRLVYFEHGRKQRTRNFWGFDKKIPDSLYNATTGIEPVDTVVKSVLKTGYCHHIERLMVLGNFMLLCGIDPDAIYQWFMELFIDAYDWVMVPNVYGMSQHADGGLMTTKPYISGSAYILKMSDFKRGEWCAVWDALYWTFIDRHADFFKKNPRMMVMVKMRDKLGKKMDAHRRVARQFLDGFYGL